MSTEKAEVFPTAVVNAPTKDADLITFALAVYGGFKGNAIYTSPDPTLAVFYGHITDFQVTQTTALGRGKGTAQARNAKRRNVKTDLTQLCGYAQKVCLTLPSAADARAAITSVFFSIKKSASVHKPQLAAKNTGVSGTVALAARSVGPGSTYYWEISTDQKTWTRAPDTLKGKTTIAGLTPATTYYFRFHALTRKGPVDYSQVVSLLVH